MTGRELAEALLALPDPDAPVFAWNPGEYWSVDAVHLQQDGIQPWSFIMLEKNMVERSEVSDACRAQHCGR